MEANGERLLILQKGTANHPQSVDTVYGIATSQKDRWFVYPLLDQNAKWIRVDRPSVPVADGALVEVNVTRRRGRIRESVVTNVIPRERTASIASDVALQRHGVPTHWPNSLVGMRREDFDLSASSQRRQDLRGIPFVTIDGVDARDFDDAVYAARTADGWKLLVAIADVAEFVAEDSDLDRTAKARGNSVYLPDRVVPMLPEILSSDLCSLRPFEDRLAVVCELDLSE